jgi:hypothetical protein
MEFLFTFTRFLYDAMPEAPFMLLVVLLALAWYIMRSAERAGSFWATLFDDEAGKRSTMRVCCLWAFAVSSAVLAYVTINFAKTPDGLKNLEVWYLGYLLIWSGAPVASKFLDVIAARWAK